MNLGKLIKPLDIVNVTGSTDLEVTGISDDSRQVKPGNLFIAVKGLTVDSHDFIPEVIKNGAAAVIGEKPLADLLDIPYIQVPSSRFALGKLASEWFDNPSSKLKVIGVTGTEGKTTTSNLIYHILSAAGKKTGLISTINAKIGTEIIDTGLHVTNPEALPLQELLAKMVEAGCEYAVLETTSMGLHQGRVAGVNYEVGVLTNFAQDHLDYHKTMDSYREAKVMLFKKVKKAVLNRDDESYGYFAEQTVKDAKILSYGLAKNADVKAENVEFDAQGTKFNIYMQGQTLKINSQLLGPYNVSNMLAAATACLSLGMDWKDIKPGLESFTTPEGRLERIDIDGNPPAGGFSVFVDFAHTPNALEKVLGVLREVTPKDKRLITLYGAAGERDALKRPAMGKAARHADITIFTADDPRSEEVLDITRAMEEGAVDSGVKHVYLEELDKDNFDSPVYAIEPDRTLAISKVLEIAREGDIVALLGKGHEKSLALKGEEIPWSDQETARKILRKLNKN